jgi:hypothetical protein
MCWIINFSAAVRVMLPIRPGASTAGCKKVLTHLLLPLLLLLLLLLQVR